MAALCAEAQADQSRPGPAPLNTCHLQFALQPNAEETTHPPSKEWAIRAAPVPTGRPEMEERVCGLPLLCLKPVIEFWGIWSLRTWMKGAGTPALRPGRPGKLSAGSPLRTVIFCHCFQLRQLAELDKPPGMLLQEPVGSGRGHYVGARNSQVIPSFLPPSIPSFLLSLAPC